jgi:hypothetical protein
MIAAEHVWQFRTVDPCVSQAACEAFIFSSLADLFQAQISADRICPFFSVITYNVAPKRAMEACGDCSWSPCNAKILHFRGNLRNWEWQTSTLSPIRR